MVFNRFVADLLQLSKEKYEVRLTYTVNTPDYVTTIGSQHRFVFVNSKVQTCADPLIKKKTSKRKFQELGLLGLTAKTKACIHWKSCSAETQ